jgi:hypothetical protein
LCHDLGENSDGDGDVDRDMDGDTDVDNPITVALDSRSAPQDAGNIRHTGATTMGPAPTSDVTATLISAMPDQVALNETRTIRAGTTTGPFWVEPANDARPGEDIGVIIPIAAAGYRAGSALFTVRGYEDGDEGLGILEVDPDNPRYFRDSSTRQSVHLSGPYTWWNIQDIDQQYPPREFDFDRHINWLRDKGYNHTRLWNFESAYWYSGGTTKLYVVPNVYQRTGPGLANDGRPKFDVTKLNQAYFDRLRERVIKARDNGIYVSVMFFQGIASTDRVVEWEGHPFNVNNNVNGINGDLNNNGAGSETHTLRNPDVVDAQRLHIRKAVDTLNDLDNVIWEIGNEIYPGPDQIEWAYDTIEYIREYESTKPNQHLIGLSYMHSYNDGGAWTRASPEVMFDSPADWISVGWREDWDDYRLDPPPATGEKVIISDVDHLWGTFDDSQILDARNWVWKSVTMSLHTINMEYGEPSNYPAATLRAEGRREVTAVVRDALASSLKLLERFDLSNMRPRSDLSSLPHCLAEAGRGYLIYKPQPNRDTFTVGGLIPGNEYEYEWFDTVANKPNDFGTLVPSETTQSFRPPTPYALLYLKNIE